MLVACGNVRDFVETYVIRSFLSFSFFRPPKAILVPGMYFLGFSRYSNCGHRSANTIWTESVSFWLQTYQSILLPLDALLLVGIGVRVALDRAGVTTEQTVQSRANLVAAASLNGVALSATGLEEVGTLLGVT